MKARPQQRMAARPGLIAQVTGAPPCATLTPGDVERAHGLVRPVSDQSPLDRKT
jgi:hypothetical protein